MENFQGFSSNFYRSLESSGGSMIEILFRDNEREAWKFADW